MNFFGNTAKSMDAFASKCFELHEKYKKKMFKTVVKINIKKLIIKNVCAFLLMHLITRYSGKTKNYHDFDVIMNV